jgi:hypothetical protein
LFRVRMSVHSNFTRLFDRFFVLLRRAICARPIENAPTVDLYVHILGCDCDTE